MNPDPSPQWGRPRSVEECLSRDRATTSGFHPLYPGAADPLAAAWYVRVSANYTDFLFLLPGSQAFAHRYTGDHVSTGPRDRAQLAAGGSADSVVDAVLEWPRG